MLELESTLVHLSMGVEKVLGVFVDGGGSGSSSQSRDSHAGCCLQSIGMRVLVTGTCINPRLSNIASSYITTKVHLEC